MRRASPRVDLALTIGTGVLVGLVAVLLPAWLATAVVAGVLAGLWWWLPRRDDGGRGGDAIQPGSRCSAVSPGNTSWKAGRSARSAVVRPLRVQGRHR
jgi:hypothetical protein